MSVSLRVTFPAPGDNILSKMVNVNKDILVAIKRGLDYGLQLAVALMKEDRFSGTGPFPVSEHRLGVRSGQLQDSIRATPAVIRGTTVSAEVGSSVRYAGVHEYGMTIYPKNKKFLSFKIDDVWIRAKKVTIPAREPFRYGLQDGAEVISGEIMEDVNTAIDVILSA